MGLHQHADVEGIGCTLTLAFNGYISGASSNKLVYKSIATCSTQFLVSLRRQPSPANLLFSTAVQAQLRSNTLPAQHIPKCLRTTGSQST